jgi:hypothetical protein
VIGHLPVGSPIAANGLLLLTHSNGAKEQLTPAQDEEGHHRCPRYHQQLSDNSDTDGNTGWTGERRWRLSLWPSSWVEGEEMT